MLGFAADRRNDQIRLQCVSCGEDCVRERNRHGAEEIASFALEAMAVAEFYGRVEELLRSLHLQVHLWPVPVEVADQWKV